MKKMVSNKNVLYKIYTISKKFPMVCIYKRYTFNKKDFRISDLVKTRMELIFNPCGEFRLSTKGPFSQIHAGAPGIFSDLLRTVQMLTRQWGGESNGKLTHLFIPSKTASLVPEFSVSEFAVKDLPLGRAL